MTTPTTSPLSKSMLTPSARRFRDMIKTFADKRIQDLYIIGFARHCPPDVAKRALHAEYHIPLESEATSNALAGT